MDKVLMSPSGLKRKLTAIFSADVQGYSRLMSDDEEATIRTLSTHRELMSELIHQHRGRVVDSPGDNLLAEFASVLDAVESAAEIQKALKAQNEDLPDHRKMVFRIGINMGDVFVDGERIYGDGVNTAARLESLAEGGGICISGTVYDQVEAKLPLGYEFMGEQRVKNIARPVRAYRVYLEPDMVPPPPTFLSNGAPSVGARAKALLNFGKWALVAGLAALALALGLTSIFDFTWDQSPQKTNIQTNRSVLRSIPMRGPWRALLGKDALALPDKPSLAVLPFVNMNKNPDEEYFSDGITEDLITDISKVSGLFVIARNSVFTYKGKTAKAQQVGRELGVRYILEGSVRKEDDRVRITAQLIDATTGFHLWAERYDRNLSEIFSVQDEVTRKIVSALKVKLTQAEQSRVGRRSTKNLQAYDLLLRGQRNQHRSTQESVDRARKLFTRAIALDPKYANGYVALGWTYIHSWAFQWSQDPRTLDRALELAQKAKTLDELQPELHKLFSKVYLWKKQHDMATQHAEQAITLNPNDADGYEALGEIRVWSGEPNKAVDLIKKAMRLNPTSHRAHVPWLLGHAYFLSGKNDQAIAQWKTAIALNPNFLPAHAYLAFLYSEMEKMEEAKAHLGHVVRISPNATPDNLRGRLPYKNDEMTERVITALKKIEP